MIVVVFKWGLDLFALVYIYFPSVIALCSHIGKTKSLVCLIFYCLFVFLLVVLDLGLLLEG